MLVYFSGHDLQIQGKNYLVPVNNDFQNKSETEIARRCVGLHEIEEIILNDRSKSKPALVIFILDACRNNPFSSGSSVRGADLRIAKGLAPVNVNRYDNSTDLLYLFATAPGNIADDAPNEPNGRFTGALLKFLGPSHRN